MSNVRSFCCSLNAKELVFERSMQESENTNKAGDCLLKNIPDELVPAATVKAGDVLLSNTSSLTLIAGPCQIESQEHAFDMAGALKEIAQKTGIGLVYKSSFDKANRTSFSAQRGIGLDKALKIFSELKSAFDIPILTDVHTQEQCFKVAEVVDILQIPAFLCRQTDLLISAAKTGRIINIKKGQFLAPWDMKNVLEKVLRSGNSRVMLCERGTCFGYNALVSDMRSLPIMAALGAPVIFDATHSVQQPGGLGGFSGGQREFIEALACAAVAVGVAGIFLETHQNPDHAPSDGMSMIRLTDLEPLLQRLIAFDHTAKRLQKT